MGNIRLLTKWPLLSQSTLSKHVNLSNKIHWTSFWITKGGGALWSDMLQFWFDRRHWAQQAAPDDVLDVAGCIVVRGITSATWIDHYCASECMKDRSKLNDSGIPQVVRISTVLPFCFYPPECQRTEACTLPSSSSRFPLVPWNTRCLWNALWGHSLCNSIALNHRSLEA